MIAALLLVATLARADETSTYDRLFGAEVVSAEVVPNEEIASPWRLLGPAALAVVGLAGAWWVKKRAPTVGQAKQLNVVWRQSLGDRATLVLVEVLDADGETRRLLIGTGGGPPSLVADLGTCLSVDVYADVPALAIPSLAALKPAASNLAASNLAAPNLAASNLAAPNLAAPKPASRPAPGLATYASYAAAAAPAAAPAAAAARNEAAPTLRNVASELLAERRKIAC